MTHSLHREGSLDSLGRDACLFVYPARGFNYHGSGPRIRRIVEIIYQGGPVNLIVSTLRENMYAPITREQVLGSISDGAKAYCVFDDLAKLKETLVRLKKADLGISLVVSGLIDRVREMAAEIGLDPHTINLSLGIQGKTEILPPADLRQFTTMCGHGMVSPNLVRQALRQVKTGRLEPWPASVRLCGPCACGIYNPKRSMELLEELAPVYAVTRL